MPLLCEKSVAIATPSACGSYSKLTGSHSDELLVDLVIFCTQHLTKEQFYILSPIHFSVDFLMETMVTRLPIHIQYIAQEGG